MLCPKVLSLEYQHGCMVMSASWASFWPFWHCGINDVSSVRGLWILTAWLFLSHLAPLRSHLQRTLAPATPAGLLPGRQTVSEFTSCTKVFDKYLRLWE